VMNANKTTLPSLVLAGMLTVLSPSLAAEPAPATAPVAAPAPAAAPALYNVRELQVQHGRLANPTASANCSTSSGEVASMVIKAFKADGLPAFSVLGAPARTPGIARVDIYPDVVTLQPHDKECVTWVSLTAQSKDVLRVYPVETPRNLITTYWTGGLMIASSITGHAMALNDAIVKLTAAFSRQFRIDQPPSLAPHDDPVKDIQQLTPKT